MRSKCENCKKNCEFAKVAKAANEKFGKAENKKINTQENYDTVNVNTK